MKCRSIAEASLVTALFFTSGLCAQPVRVVLDMDAAAPGIQTSVTVPAGATIVPGVGVYIYDPSGTHSIRGIGYLGGVDRGIALGHMPLSTNFGTVTGLVGHVGTPVVTDSTHYVTEFVQPGFLGPEVQYIETTGSASPLPAVPVSPVFTVDVQLNGTHSGDVFRFYLLDMVSVWRGGQGGAFTTREDTWLDTGGDSTPDNTQTIYGTDPDTSIPVPPASFLVDFIDGGPSTIIIGARCYANCDGSSSPPILNANDFQCFLNEFAAATAYANCDQSASPPILNANDFQCFLNKYAAGCP